MIFIFIGLLFTRKPDFVRALIVYLAAKLVFALFNESSYYFTNEKFYICSVIGGSNGAALAENMGLCE